MFTRLSIVLVVGTTPGGLAGGDAARPGALASATALLVAVIALVVGVEGITRDRPVAGAITAFQTGAQT